MLSFEDIKGNYPAKLKGSLFAQHMIKEYLQTLVLGRISKEIPSGQSYLYRGNKSAILSRT
jgi:hypothetical protein